MKITFTKTEESEQRHFEEAFGGHKVTFVHCPKMMCRRTLPAFNPPTNFA